MSEINKKTVCPLPWVHFSAHLDSTMRICCNTDHFGFVYDNDGNPIKLSEVSSIQDYFNLNFYKEIRAKMKNGEKPEVCKKCYQIEENGGTSVRQGYLGHYLNNESFKASVGDTKEDGSVAAKVQSLDFSLSNNCNLKCIMCNPDASYPLKRDFDKLGFEYDVNFTMGAHENWKDSSAIQRLVPEIAPDLKEFLTTGGEPFLNKTHLEILKIIVKSGNAKNVTLSYHTNCTIKNEELFEIWNGFKDISVHFSIDAYGELDEYIRYGTKWNKVEENVGIMLAHQKVRAEVHSCIQATNVFNLPELYDWIKSHERRIPLMPFHIWMHHPPWLHLNILPVHLKEKAYRKLEEYFVNNPADDGYLWRERSSQILSYLKTSIEFGQDLEGLKVFRHRIRQLEELRGQKPIETLVPELGEILD